MGREGVAIEHRLLLDKILSDPRDSNLCPGDCHTASRESPSHPESSCSAKAPSYSREPHLQPCFTLIAEALIHKSDMIVASRPLGTNILLLTTVCLLAELEDFSAEARRLLLLCSGYQNDYKTACTIYQQSKLDPLTQKDTWALPQQLPPRLARQLRSPTARRAGRRVWGA